MEELYELLVPLLLIIAGFSIIVGIPTAIYFSLRHKDREQFENPEPLKQEAKNGKPSTS